MGTPLYDAQYGGGSAETSLSDEHHVDCDGARVQCEAWRKGENEVRPPSGIGNKPAASLCCHVSFITGLP